MDPGEAFRALLGRWVLTREVSGQATMTGTAEVRATTDGTADYCERVEVQTATGELFGGWQRYRVEQTAAGFALRFPNSGELFQEVCFVANPVAGLRARALHLCGKDTYDSEYMLVTDALTIRHAVRGPRKDYVSVTQFRR